MDSQNLNSTESPSILIVDDNPQNLQVLGNLLKENKYKIEFALNGEAALAWLQKKIFDLILLDINMPGMNGFEVCNKIRSNKILDNIPVIFLSAESERESILKGFELGAQDYLTKPFDSRELLSRVRTHLKLKSSLENLEQLNKTLEDRVAKRTEQLRDALEQVKTMNSKLIDLDKAKSEFLHLISHEIRTPLNGIIGPLELIKEVGDTKNIEELLDILDTSVKRLEHFSYNALLITNLKTKSYDFIEKEQSIPDLLDYCLKEKENIISKKNLRFSINVLSLKSSVKIESDLVKVCFDNIIDNAIKHSPLNSIIETNIYDEENNIVCLFKDSGSGFIEGAEDKVFDLFPMGDSRNDNSPGMGLSLAKLIMDALNGKISIGNNKVKGAFVKLIFPRK